MECSTEDGETLTWVVADLTLIRVRMLDGIDTLLNDTDRPSHAHGGEGDRLVGEGGNDSLRTSPAVTDAMRAGNGAMPGARGMPHANRTLRRPRSQAEVHNARVGQILLFAAIASVPLVIGALIGIRWLPPTPVLAAILAFAGGALTAALAFELFEESFLHGGLVSSSLGLVAGAATFIAIDVVLERRVRGRRADAAGPALLAVVVLDGVPENLALGTTFAAGMGSLPLLAAIFASNLPESLVGARSMRDDGRSVRFILGTWSAAAVLLAAAIVAGGVLLENVGGTALSGILAFAGGAVLASLADTVFPRAYRDGGPFVAFATVVGFLTAFALGSVQA